MNDTNELYLETCLAQSKVITEAYSTSFSKSVGLLDPAIRPAIYAIYGMVRIADEIVDTKWEGIDVAGELKQFEAEVHEAVRKKFSTNPALHAFAWAANSYGISEEHIGAFFVSMEMDIVSQTYTEELYRTYIYGSAEAVGLMCLSVFCNGDKALEQELTPGACSLGAAFQKVNFLRDVSADHAQRGRIYFPGVTVLPLTTAQKYAIEADIQKDFDGAASYVEKLPLSARRAVRLAYSYNRALFKKLQRLSPRELQGRTSLSPLTKLFLYGRAVISR